MARQKWTYFSFECPNASCNATVKKLSASTGCALFYLRFVRLAVRIEYSAHRACACLPKSIAGKGPSGPGAMLKELFT